jgi:hypothetical protein
VSRRPVEFGRKKVERVIRYTAYAKGPPIRRSQGGLNLCDLTWKRTKQLFLKAIKPCDAILIVSPAVGLREPRFRFLPSIILIRFWMQRHIFSRLYSTTHERIGENNHRPRQRNEPNDSHPDTRSTPFPLSASLEIRVGSMHPPNHSLNSLYKKAHADKRTTL